MSQKLLDSGSQRTLRDTRPGKSLDEGLIRLAQESEQEVLSANVAVIETHSFVMGQREYCFSRVGEASNSAKFPSVSQVVLSHFIPRDTTGKPKPGRVGGEP